MNYKSFTKFEHVICDLSKKLDCIDSEILEGVRSISSGYKNKKGVSAFYNCLYLGELAERCEERGLTTTAKNMRSILIAFVLETSCITEGDFLYDQFKTFEGIYKRVLGEDFSTLDEVLLKKCKSQISGNLEDFKLDYDMLCEKKLDSLSYEEQVLTLTALSEYKDFIEDDFEKNKCFTLLDNLLRVFIEKNVHPGIDITTYVSLSHIYDMILELTKDNRLKSFSRKEKSFYKCIKDIATTDLSTIVDKYENFYTEKEVVIGEWKFKPETLVYLTSDVMKYPSSYMRLKKHITLPVKCRKVAMNFNYMLTKGKVFIEGIKIIKILYAEQSKTFHPKHIFEYIDMKLIDDVFLYCELMKELSKLLSTRDIIDIYINFSFASNIEVMLCKVREINLGLFKEGNISEIIRLCNLYTLFNHSVFRASCAEPIDFAMYYDVCEMKENQRVILDSNTKIMLLKNNCIDLELNTFIDGKIRSIKNCNATIADVAWYEGDYSFAIDLALKYDKEFLAFEDVFYVNQPSYSRVQRSPEEVIKKFLKDLDKENNDYARILDFILVFLIKRNNVSLYKEIIKRFYDDVVSIYDFSAEDKEELLRELIFDNLDREDLTLTPDSFLVNNVGISKAFKLLNLSAEEQLKVKSNYVNKMKGYSYITPFQERVLKLIEDSLTDQELFEIKVDKIKRTINGIRDRYISSNSHINYFQKNEEIVFNYCKNELISYLDWLIEQENAESKSLLYLYLESKNVKELENHLNRLKDSILNKVIK